MQIGKDDTEEKIKNIPDQSMKSGSKNQSRNHRDSLRIPNSKNVIERKYSKHLQRMFLKEKEWMRTKIRSTRTIRKNSWTL